MAGVGSLQNQYNLLDVSSVRKRRHLSKNPEQNEQKWKKLKVVNEGQLPSAIVNLELMKHSSSTAAVDLVVAGSTRIDFNQMRLPYETQQGKQAIIASRSYSRFKNYVKRVAIRQDGKLAVAADETGLVQIFEIQSRSQLRKFKGHKGPVHACDFARNSGRYILSGGDDLTLRLWDISDGSCVFEVSDAHMDSIRCLISDPCPNRSHNSLLFATGSYDGYIKVWEFSLCEAKTYTCTHRLLHGDSVEALCYFPKGTLLVSGGGTEAKVWDLNGGGRFLHSIQAHTKIVTSISIDLNGFYIVTGSIDQTVKFHSSSDFRVLHSISVNAAVSIVTVCEGPGGSEILLIGLSNGQWQIRQKVDRGLSRIKTKNNLRLTALKANTARYYARGLASEPGPDDMIVNVAEWKRAPFLDRQIQNFRFHGTLDKVVKMGPSLVIAYIEMLIEQGVLHVAVRNRNEKTIEPLLRFINKQLAQDVTSMPVLLEFIYAILKNNEWLYSTTNDDVINALGMISGRLEFEFSQHQILRELSGIIELLSTQATGSSF